MSLRVLTVLSALIFVFSSCTRRVIPSEDVDLGREYFPLFVGHFIEYEVDSIKYNDFDKRIDTFHYQLRDEIVSEFDDNEGRKSYLVNQFKRPDATFQWSENMTYYITPTDYNLEVVEQNVRFIKLVFPIRVNTKWNGNVYIATQTPELSWYNGWLYNYSNINEPYNTGYQNFANTVTVNEASEYAGDSTGTVYSTRTFSRERYAKNVGLISREMVHWDYQELVQYRKGFILIYRAKNFN